MRQKNDLYMPPDLLNQCKRLGFLTGDQEIELGRQIQAMMSIERSFEDSRDEDGNPLKPAAIKAKLHGLEYRVYCAGGRAIDKMVRHNALLAANVAHKYLKQSDSSLDDLLQEGLIGLQTAARKFDPTMGYRFTTYAYWWVRQAISRYIQDKDRVIAIPVHVHEDIRKINKVKAIYKRDHGTSPTIDYIAEDLGWTEAKVRDRLAVSRKALSLDLKYGSNYGGDDDLSIGDRVKSDAPSPQELLEAQSWVDDFHDIVNAAIAPYSGEKRETVSRGIEILGLIHGVGNGGQPVSLAKLGDRYGVSREAVRQQKNRAVTLLHRTGSRIGKGCG